MERREGVSRDGRKRGMRGELRGIHGKGKGGKEKGERESREKNPGKRIQEIYHKRHKSGPKKQRIKNILNIFLRIRKTKPGRSHKNCETQVHCYTDAISKWIAV